MVPWASSMALLVGGLCVDDLLRYAHNCRPIWMMTIGKGECPQGVGV